MQSREGEDKFERKSQVVSGNKPKLLERGGIMEEPGEQCTVVFALIVTEPASECVCVEAPHPPLGGSVTIYAKTTVLCSPDSFLGGSNRARTFKLLRSPGNRFQGINSVSLCSLVGQYDNPIPTRFLLLSPHRLFKNSSSADRTGDECCTCMTIRHDRSHEWQAPAGASSPC